MARKRMISTKNKRMIVSALLVVLSLLSFGFSRPIMIPILEYEIIGFITPGLIVGLLGVIGAWMVWKKKV